MAAAGLGGYGFVHTAAFGRAPRGARLDRILASPHFTQGHFENLVPVPIMPEEVDNKENRFSAMWKFLFGNKSALSPARPLVSKKTDLIALPRDEDIAVWMGHSNFYLQLGGRRILIDPTFGAYASPVWFINRAFAGSNIYTADDIPPLDVLAISHDHWDHLDYPTVMALKEKAAHVVCPLGVGEYFEQWGFDAAHFADIGRRFGGFNLVLAECGQYNMA
ncbi:MBL fold metallo-hydrolase [Selenomonas sp.]|uniref:MBL fold metallo-hydrolase n=1 Tax=Selenomonas sp. TaxID=2053611 RepID=UPI00345B547C